MLLAYTLALAAGGSVDDQTEQRCKLTHGVITRVEVEFPSGCSGLVYVHIDQALHQVWPTNPEGTLRSDGRAIVWADYYELFTDPFEIELVGYNEDDTYQHEILFRFELTSQEIAERGKDTATVIGKLRKLVGI